MDPVTCDLIRVGEHGQRYILLSRELGRRLLRRGVPAGPRLLGLHDELPVGREPGVITLSQPGGPKVGNFH